MFFLKSARIQCQIKNRFLFDHRFQVGYNSVNYNFCQVFELIYRLKIGWKISKNSVITQIKPVAKYSPLIPTNKKFYLRFRKHKKGFENIKNSNDLSFDSKIIFSTTKFTKLLLIKHSQNLRDNTNTMVQKYFGRIISTTNGITQIKSSSK